MDVSKITGNAHYFKDMPNPKLDEVKVLLDNNAPAQKLEGMKRLIAMISKGKDVSNLFPEVVKNVVCPNVEVKKLVYMYLIHYAEFQQDAALLAINTFQKDLDNPNQLIRAQALRVMSSIRLKVIVQIIQLAIKKCVTDSSPYVRKMAAHAITKVYSLDLAMKEELIECIDTLLGDNTTLVLGSAIGAFSIVCPERYDLIHGHFRKICNMLADTDEWGQVNIINLLTRYIRHHFVDPNPDSVKKKPRTPIKKKKKEGFYSDSESGSESSSEEEDDYDKNYEPEMDPDHRLALRAAAPLLQSRNSAVVVAVAQLFLYCAPETEAIKVGKSLVRCCRNHREIQFIVLQNVATMAVARPEMFAPYLTEFFIEETDPVYIRNLKLEIITCLASEGNISRILREFTFYVHREEKKFVRNVIQAIVRCASQLQEVQETCMQGLLSLITNDSEVVVAESVVAIKKLLQMGAGEHDGVVKSLVKLLDNITVPAARASIVWCAGEYAEKIPKLAPDILRKLAKTFSDEDTTVKIQVLNLAAKLILHNPQQTHLIVQYVLNMAKYDMSYDLRDRARVYRGLLLRPGAPLTPFARRLILTEKPSPEDIQPSAERSKWAIGSMSQLVGHTVAGYLEIGEWAEVAADPAPRSVIPKKQRKDFVGMGSDSFRSSASHSSGGGGATFGGPPAAAPAWARASTGSTASSFYDDESDEDASYTGSDDYSDEEGSYSDSYSDYSDEYSDESDEDDRRGGRGGKGRAAPAAAPAAAAGGGASLASFFGGAPAAAAAPPAASSASSAFFGFAPPSAASPAPVAAASPASLLNEFAGFGISSSSPAMVPSSAPAGSLFGAGSPSSSSSSAGLLSLNASAFSGAPERPREVLLKRVVGNGLQVEYQFQRRASIHGADVSVIQLWFSNHSDGPITNVRLGEKEWPEDGATIYPFDVIPVIPTGGNCEGPFNIKFTSLTKAVRFQISVGDQFGQSYSVQITPPVGELIKAVPLGHPGEFEELQKKMGGLNESTGTVSVPGPQVSKVGENILAAANLATIEYNEGAGVYKFSGRSLLGNEQILIDVAVDDDGKAKCKVNCDNAILGNMLLTRIKTALSKS